MEHDGCKGCKYEQCEDDSKYCNGCKQNAVDKYTRMTNADRIRSMSDEELAQFLIKTDCCLAKSEHVDCSNQEECGVCEEMIRSWLQSEVEI